MGSGQDQALALAQKHVNTPFIPYTIEVKTPLDDILFHHKGARGHIGLFYKTHDKELVRHYIHLNEISMIIDDWVNNNEGKDLYYTQNTFYRPNKKSSNVQELKALFIDIDCYKVGYSPDEAIKKILEDYVDEGLIPKPNIIVKSGRGVYLKWWLAFTPFSALKLWNAIETRFYDLLKPFGADPVAKSASTILRMCGTANSKSTNVVEAVVYHEYRYVLRDIQRNYLPDFKSKKRIVKKVTKEKQLKEGQINQKFYSNYSRNYSIVKDIKKLVELRDYNVTGMRENILFLFRYHSLLVHGNFERALDDTLEMNRCFTSPLSDREVRGATGSAEKAYSKPNELISVSENVKGRYLYSNKTLIEILAIQPEEMTHLYHLIDSNEKQRRNTIYNREKRRENGVKSREEYVTELRSRTDQDRQIKMDQITALKKKGFKQKDIAKIMGLTPGRVSQLLKLVNFSGD